jgi:hypothetical protein
VTAALLLAAAGADGPAPARPSPEPTAAGPPPQTSALPFDLPPPETLRASPRKAFAHYIPTFPRSFDDEDPASDYYARNYLTRDGEGGRHAAYGGYLRDRPVPRAPLRRPDWALEDLRVEVRQAVRAGLDGFTLDLLQLGDTGGAWWDTSQLLLQAAAEAGEGFSVVLMPDMGALDEVDPVGLARWTAHLAASPAAHRLEDGRLLVAPYRAEQRPPDWWREYLRLLSQEHGVQAALLPVFLDERPQVAAFAGLAWGASNWGSRSPAANDPSLRRPGSPFDRAQVARRLGLRWMQPVSVQDVRPREGVFDEAEATTNLRTSWELAIAAQAELVQLVTWNDYAETTAFAPSERHGWAFLDVSAWYLTRWKTGAEPEVVRDTVVLTHRTQRVGTPPSGGQPLRLRLRGGSSPARDVVEVLSFATRPGTVRLSVGGRTTECRVDAGMDVCTAPLGPGEVRAELVRDDDVAAAVSSPYRLDEAPVVEDLQYVSVSSGRS